ncbi:hypothetical protein J2789_000156 [Variovorax paradoxus]|uniref:hypothetical protein n=1 Tax=Variovorax atrisoli TaxID=3394203 RepID=UPI00119B71A0|nr:hypothetical protein [Variovorax paradoxus]MDR6517494.1 hypothetical protein [Variovorax paradoxus]
MRNLIFNSLTIASPSQRSANRFEFHPQFNLITGPDNSIGKSTLVKLLLWSFGCDPILDSAWTATESQCIVDFTLDGKAYSVGRNGNMMVLSAVAGQFERFGKISGEYSRRLADLVGFDMLLANRSDPPELEPPPPAYFFLPFYIDQRRSWSAAWNGFGNLAQYANWQRPVISYHTGYLLPEHFEYASKIAVEVAAVKAANKGIERISGAIAVVEELAPAVKRTSAGQPVEQLITEISEDVGALQRELDATLQHLARIREQAAQLGAQRQLLEAAAQELGQDYIFAVEHTSGDHLQCPLCGTLHDNTLFQRTGLLADKAAAEADLGVVVDKETTIREKVALAEEKIRVLRDKIDAYSSRFEAAVDSKETSEDFITRLSSAAIQQMAQRTKDEAEKQVALREREERRLKGLQRKLLSKSEKTALDKRFQALLNAYVHDLGASGVNLSGVQSPLNYARLFGSGGAAEGTRAVLGYYLAVLTMVQEGNNEAIPPLIVDTPNQHEQTDYNYEVALRLIKDKISASQVFVCAMDTEVIQPYKPLGKVTLLEPGKRLLDSSKFAAIWSRVEPFFNPAGG